MMAVPVAGDGQTMFRGSCFVDASYVSRCRIGYSNTPFHEAVATL